ncbi:LOB DOMAIN-CONTAINING PROTEIN 4-RELATED [Salix viminalis]|uniref:LOB DOMAIN-CONTAINING PROTEIN 4-RELATED n=1 Tax=Salix viminalis TaxID=40686 RepID=A0A9Q0Z3V2_SALVM|nr:LOB DOMAIN-CONTAINING PROTEIN 4-RELATED [Salix viminalis]
MDMIEQSAAKSPINVPSQFPYSPSSSSPPYSHHYSPTTYSSPSKSSPNLTPPSAATPPPPPVVVSPCAACKILRRRCVDKCVLAPYFPPSEPYKFTIAHRVFGASNIIKFLQELPESQRADAVSELQAQLAKAQAEVVNMQCQQANLVALLCMEMTQSQQEPILQQHVDTSCFLDENNLGTSWEPLWT